VAWDQHLIAEPEGPSFISRTVTQPPYGPAVLVTQGPPLPTLASHKVGRANVAGYFRRAAQVIGTAAGDPTGPLTWFKRTGTRLGLHLAKSDFGLLPMKRVTISDDIRKSLLRDGQQPYER
jgi:hypothetical protein